MFHRLYQRHIPADDDDDEQLCYIPITNLQLSQLRTLHYFTISHELFLHINISTFPTNIPHQWNLIDGKPTYTHAVWFDIRTLSNIAEQSHNFFTVTAANNRTIFLTKQPFLLNDICLIQRLQDPDQPGTDTIISFTNLQLSNENDHLRSYMAEETLSTLPKPFL